HHVSATPEASKQSRSRGCRRGLLPPTFAGAKGSARNDNRNLVRAGKFAVVLARRREVGRMGGLRGIESALVINPSIHGDFCTPLPRLAAKVDTLISGSVVPRTASVRVVL